jgi:hypothetical protein
MVVGLTSANAKPLALTFTASAASQDSLTQFSLNQPEKSFRWVVAGQRVKKDHARQEQRRNALYNPTSLRDPGFASSDEDASPSSDDSSSEGNTAAMPYPYRLAFHPVLTEVLSPYMRRMFSHCEF